MMLFFFSHVCRIIDWNRSVNVLFSDVSKPLDDDCTVCSVQCRKVGTTAGTSAPNQARRKSQSQVCCLFRTKFLLGAFLRALLTR